MAKFRGKGSMTQVPLQVYYSDQQITKNRAGEMTGVYLDVQVDQSGFTDQDVLSGKAQTNPHLDTHKTNNGRTSHSVWYSKHQFDAMLSVGKPVPLSVGNHVRNVIGLQADLMAKDGHVVVLTPKDVNKVNTVSERAEILSYNSKHELNASPNALSAGFGIDESMSGMLKPDSIIRHNDISGVAKAVRFGDFAKDNIKHLEREQYSMLAVCHAPGESPYSRQAEVFVEAAERMLDRDGRFYPMDYSLATDRAAFLEEAKNHAGYIEIDRNGNYTVHRGYEDSDDMQHNFAEEFLDKEHTHLIGRRDRGAVEFAWLDSIEQQEEQERTSSPLLPAKSYKEWPIAMTSYQFELKSNLEGQNQGQKSMDAELAKAFATSMDSPAFDDECVFD